MSSRPFFACKRIVVPFILGIALSAVWSLHHHWLGREVTPEIHGSAGGLKELGLNEVSRNSRPNIIFILVDDADRGLVEPELDERVAEWFPNISRLSREGVGFTNFHVTVPVCGPSRAAFLSSVYASRSGIRCNDPSARRSRGTGGGFTAYRRFGHFGTTAGTPFVANDLGVWMKHAGYKTMFIGKYLHEDFVPQRGENWKTIQPPGWDDFLPSLGARYFRTSFIRAGVFVSSDSFADDEYPSKYRTDIETVDAMRLLRAHNYESAPCFLLFAPFAPHLEDMNERSLDEDQLDKGMVAPVYKRMWPDINQRFTPEFDELDNSDKPRTIQQFSRITERLFRGDNNQQIPGHQYLQKEFRRRVLSMKSVDDMVGELLKTLADINQLENTIIVFTSDNGFHLGQQRHFGKLLPYNRSTNVPLVVWGPKYVPASERPLSHLLSSVDIAPTLLEFAGGNLESEIDGRSFKPTLDGRFQGEESDWRSEGILIEHWESVAQFGGELMSSYQQLRLHQEIYTEWADGDVEYYDLRIDPWQLENSAHQLPSERIAELKSQLAAIKPKSPEPLAFIEVPFHAGINAFRKLELEGLAEYHRGIAAVDLFIEETTDTESTRFWNGGGFVAERISVPANLSNAGGILTEWRYEFAPPSARQLVQRNFRVCVVAKGTDGTESALGVKKEFSIENRFPVSQILSPAPRQSVRSSPGILISGESRNITAPSIVKLRIFDIDRGRFWNGRAWQEEPANVNARIVTQVDRLSRWDYMFTPGRIVANLRVSVVAVCDENGPDDHPTVIHFELF
ncbi:MAG TPA: sulfatase-like hydrolase/transferase [Pirellulaceae bacterium]|nr:sulfatase-like hydrolase/transferase [Pirellulaceae bacterium]